MCGQSQPCPYPTEVLRAARAPACAGHRMLRRLAMPLVKARVTQEIVDYLARHARQDEVLERVARQTADMPRAEMATPPDEAALLTLLARLVGARRALESGRSPATEPF